MGRHNSDNVHSRAIIVGLVNLLNSKVYFENVLSDNNIDFVYVPFFYNMGGDERFLQDYFLEWSECIHPRHADGNYDVIPRGIVTMSSKTIDTSKMTHRFVRGTYVKEVNGELQQFNAFINSLPISMNFDVEIEVDTNLDAFKVEQAIMETFYKTQVFSVSFRGFRVPCQVGFAEDYGVEKTFEFTYQSDAKVFVKFSLSVEAYYPVIDSTTERSNSNRMNAGENGPSLFEGFTEQYVRPRFSFELPRAEEKYFSLGVMPITWSNTGPVLRVNLYYRIAGSQNWRPIAKNYQNSGYYNWDIPIFDTNGNEIPFETHRTHASTSTGRGAKLRAIIDGIGSVENIVIFNKGFSYSPIDKVETELFPMPPIIPPGFTAPIIQPDVVAGEIKSATIVDSGAGFVPSPITEIEIKIEDANTELVYAELMQVFTFTGDVDNSLPSPNNTYVTNVVPTVSTLQTMGNLIGLKLEGIGIPTGSIITSVDPVLNRIGINNTVNMQVIGGTLNTSPTMGKVYIQ